MKADRKIEGLVDKYLEGRCSSVDLEILGERLETDASARDYYLEMLILHEDLGHLTTTRRLENSEIIPIGLLVEREKKSTLVMALASAAAMVAILLIAFSIVRVKPAPPLFAFATSPGTQFKVIHASPSDKKRPENGLEKGSRIELSQGVLELESADGTKAVMQGSTTLTVVSEGHFALSRGKAWFRASETKGSLLVTTPLLNIRDLGTEFGVITAQDSKMPEVHVFDGKVEVEAKDGLRAEQLFEAGDAARLKFPGRFESFESNESLFFNRLPTNRPYAEISFEEGRRVGLEPAKGSLPSVQEMSPRWMCNLVSGYTEGIVGKAARFSGENSAIITNYVGPDRVTPFSLSVWMRYSGEGIPQNTQVILGWGTTVPEENLEMFSLNIQPWGEEMAVAQLVVDKQQYIGETNLADGQWHHLMVTRRFGVDSKESSLFEVYVDGIEEVVKSFPFGGGSHSSLVSKLDKRNLLFGMSDFNPRNPLAFNGAVDEFRIYEHVVSAKEIEDLSRR